MRYNTHSCYDSVSFFHLLPSFSTFLCLFLLCSFVIFLFFLLSLFVSFSSLLSQSFFTSLIPSFNLSLSLYAHRASTPAVPGSKRYISTYCTFLQYCKKCTNMLCSYIIVISAMLIATVSHFYSCTYMH